VCPPGFRENNAPREREAEERCLFYVGVTRARDVVAFTRAASYNAQVSEIWIARVHGGPATKIVSAAEPSITELYDGPIHDSWPRFTPELARDGGDVYYAIAFSSQRGPGTVTGKSAPAARMFFAFIKRGADGALSNVGLALIPGQTFDADDRTIDARGLASVKPIDPVR